MIDRNAENDVLMAFCHNGTVATTFMNSLLAAFAQDMRRDRRRLVEYHDAAGPYIHDNRARIARYFLEHTDFQWLWMLDNDMEFPSDALYQLLDVAEGNDDVRILGAAYWNNYPGTPTYLSWLAFTPTGIRAVQSLPERVDANRDEPIEVSAVGMGCTLIHRSALQDVADMYANDPWDTFGADILVRFEDGGFAAAPSIDDFKQHVSQDRKIVSIDRCGEDVTFCLRARRAGHVSYGLPSLVAEHHKTHRVRHGDQEDSGVALVR